MPRGLAKGSVVQRGQSRANGLAWARTWRDQHRAEFDAMDAQGMFSDSPHPRRA